MKTTLKAILTLRLTPWLLLAATLAATAAFVLKTSLLLPPPDPQLEAVTARIRARGQEYGKGLALIVDGDSTMGRNLLASATDRMSVAAEECMHMERCDAVLVLEALSEVLNQQRIALAEARKAHRSRPPAPPGVQEQPTDESPAITDLPQMHRAVALLRGTPLRELITFNGAVKSALNDWLTWNRPQLVDAYENYLFLRADTAPIYEKADLPEALLFALMAQETGVKVHSYSRAGAAGPLQFMPRTGKRYGLIRVGSFDMRLDPVASTRASAKYLNEQLARLNNDLEKALAAYNGGESRLATLHRTLKGASFWDPELYYAVPAETRDYVPGVLAAAWIFLHPEDYGLSFPQLEVGATEIVLKEDASIGELTICVGQEHNRNGWFRTLRNLNPRLSGDKRIEAGTTIRLPSMLVPSYVEHCAGESPLMAQARELHDAAYEGDRKMFEYKVKKGDTLASIAGRFGCGPASRLARLNDIKGPTYAIRVGQRLTVMKCS